MGLMYSYKLSQPRYLKNAHNVLPTPQLKPCKNSTIKITGNNVFSQTVLAKVLKNAHNVLPTPYIKHYKTTQSITNTTNTHSNTKQQRRLRCEEIQDH